MSPPLLATKLYRPPPRPQSVLRPHLIARLQAGLAHAPGVTLISAPAGFGKTTLVSAWLAEAARPVAWLSLDAGDNDPARLLVYLVAALQTLHPAVGAGVVGALQSPQPPPTEALLTLLLHDLHALPAASVLVLDDYHLLEAPAVEQAVGFLLDHLPPALHLVIATRQDPALALARWRAGGTLTELRAADLRFTLAEAAGFLNQVMGLALTADDVAALEARTEGWVAGLQLAALALRGPLAGPDPADAARFIHTFSGSHRYIMDYLVEEVLHQQPAALQTFLLRTALLDRLCGPLCEAVLLAPAGSGQATLEQLERANLFIVPLDHERRWYRYHHLFADLLRQRFLAAAGAGAPSLAELHMRASQWYEDHGLALEAFHHAAAAPDIERAERLVEGPGLPLHLPGAVTAILHWLAGLPPAELNARPALWWRYASILLVSGQTTGVAEKLDAAEAALPAGPPDADARRLIGRIAGARAVLALTRYQAAEMLAQSRRSLDFLDPQYQSARANAYWTLGFAHLYQKERAAARAALTEAIRLSQASGDLFTTILATIGLGNAQEGDNQLPAAAETYQRVLGWVGDQPQQIIHTVHLGLAQIYYQWNDLAAAERHARLALALARQYDRVIDRYVICEVFLARLQLAHGDLAGAAAQLAQAAQTAREHQWVLRLPEVAAAQTLTLLRQGQRAAAAQAAHAHDLPLSQARVQLAQGDPAAALATLERHQRRAEINDWQDDRLHGLVLLAVALQADGQAGAALQRLGEALALAEPGGFIRLFVDEGPPLASLLAAAAARGLRPDYVARLRAALEAEAGRAPAAPAAATALREPLTPRELEVLQLIAQGLSNHEISARLFLAVSTVKGYNQTIFDKLQVQRRTEAVARARALGLL